MNYSLRLAREYAQIFADIVCFEAHAGTNEL